MTKTEQAEAAALVAVEWGYRCCEKGWNLEKTRQEFVIAMQWDHHHEYTLYIAATDHLRCRCGAEISYSATAPQGDLK